MLFKIYDYLPDESKSIRTAVFINEQGFCDEFDETDNLAFHIVVYDDNAQPAAVCRVFKGEGNFFVLGRLAVLKEFRGKNIGTAVINEAEKLTLSKGGKSIMLHAQCRVKSFYHKLGYRAFGTEDEDEGCPHIWMKKEL